MERVEITGIGSELQGVGRLADGRAVFVPGALPGEIVECVPVKQADRWCEAHLINVCTASTRRVDSDCPCYGECGGCAARHMDYAYSLELKREKVYNVLKRIGGIEEPNVLPTIGCDQPNRNRNKAEFAVAVNGNDILIGSMAAKSHRIVAYKDCLLQKKEVMTIIDQLRSMLLMKTCAKQIKYIVTRVNRNGEICVTLSCSAPIRKEARQILEQLRAGMPSIVSGAFCLLKSRPFHALDGKCEILIGNSTITDTLLGLSFELSPQSFFQVDPVQAERLYTCALDTIGINENMRIIDAYCGAGTITLAAARKAKFAVGVEIVPPAIENAKQNARANGLFGKTRFICADAAKEIPRLIRAGEHFDAAILDPPRKGADAELLRSIASVKIPKIAYVSCDPATLSRDVKILSQLGYSMEYAQPVDMFAGTGHVETVCLLSRYK